MPWCSTRASSARRPSAPSRARIEYWARVGKAVEPLLRGDEALRLKQRGEAVPLSELLQSVDSKAGHDRVSAHLRTRPFPHFEPAPGRPGLLVKIDEDGKRTLGRFVNRQFRPAARR